MKLIDHTHHDAMAIKWAKRLFYLWAILKGTEWLFHP